MTVDEFNRELDRVDVMRFPLLILGLRATESDGVCVVAAEMYVKDMMTGERMEIPWEGRVPLEEVARWSDIEDPACMRYVREYCRAIVLHELDECFFVDGDQPFYPFHSTDKPKLAATG